MRGHRSSRREPFVEGGSHLSREGAIRQQGREDAIRREGEDTIHHKGGSHLRESFIDKGGRHSSREGRCCSSSREGHCSSTREGRCCSSGEGGCHSS